MSTNRFTTSHRPICLLAFFLICFFLPKISIGQNSPQPVAEWLESNRPFADFKPVALFQRDMERSNMDHIVEHASLLTLNPAAADELLHVAPPALRFAIPKADGSTLELELAQVEILAPGFSVGTLGNNAQDNVPYHRAVHYRGVVQGNPGSIACLSVTSSGLMGMVSDADGTYQLGQMEDGSGIYIYYRTKDLKATSPNACFSDEESLVGDAGDQPAADDRGIGCKTVQVYFECDYKLYTDKGSSSTNVTNYVTSLFNQISTLYANENIGIAISQIYVWTSSDPYASYTSTSSVLNAFRTNKGTNFNGNLAHFLSTRNLGGGVAYVDVICFKNYAFGVSAITTSFQNVPTYSWSVEVVTHELGHNLGSWHTHSCNWPTGALDNCVSPEGSCPPGPAPSNGGTIMSYCHLTSYGINFTKGFGPTPGAKIRDKVLNATCLTQSGVVPIGLASSNITGTSAMLTWTAVAGATTYTIQYKLSNSGQWTIAGTSTAATYNLTGLAANSAYNWQVKTDCSNYSATANFSTVSGGGGGGGGSCSAPTGLSTTNISSTGATLVWGSVSGATNYTVQYKPNSSSIWIPAGNTVSLTMSISGLSGATAYNWQVKANCSSWSGTANFTTPNGGGGGGCNPPATLTNNSVGSTSASISWSSVSGASSYTLQIKLATSSTYFTLGSVPVTSVVISGLQSGTSYHWRVKANCSDYSAAKLLTTNSNLQGDGASNFSQPTLSEASNAGLLELFPNPANDLLNLRFAGEILPDNQVVVTDALGRILIEQVFGPTLDVAALAPGVYFVNLLEKGQRIATERFVKVKQ